MIHWIDWVVIITYILLLLYLGWWLGNKQSSTEEYFVGARSLTWPLIGISAMATQLSTISFISAPGFVGLREGGGLIWLGYEFAVPIAMILLIIIIYPVFYKAKIITIYEYLNTRFDSSVRLAISLVFQLGRVFATGITIHATAIVFETAFNIDYIITLIIVAIVTIVYATMGGIKAVIYADVIQMVIIFAGIFVCGLFALNLIGGWETFTATLDPNRLNAIDFGEWGFRGEHEFGFWPLLVGGLFLYLSYYGCDQTQSQRLISSKNMWHLKTALLFNGLARYPMVLAYCMMGLLIGTFAMMSPEFMQAIPKDAANVVKADYMLPTFIVHYLPVGVIGLLLVAVLSAAMSSISGTINSLSAASLKDVIIPYFKKDMDDKQAYRWSLGMTVFWGIVCTLAVVFAQIAPTVIEAINKVGSLFFGCILGIFFLGMCTKKTNAYGSKIGLILGIGVNMYLWLLLPELSWFWWNITGFATTALFGYVSSLIVLYYAGRPANTKQNYILLAVLTLGWGFIVYFLYLLLHDSALILVNLAGKLGSVLIASIISTVAIAMSGKNRSMAGFYSLAVALISLLVLAIWLIFLNNQDYIIWFLATYFVMAIFSYFTYAVPDDHHVDENLLATRETMNQPGLAGYAITLILYFVFIIGFSMALKHLLT
jgi:solute carrier family 5 (sodium-dependent multivitamin transporter), member 6